MTLALSDFEALSKKLRETGVFVEARIVPNVLYQAYLDGLVVFELNTARDIILFGVLWKTLDPKQFEMGTFWKDSMYYKDPASELIFKALLAKAPKESTLFISTTTQTIKDVARNAGWTLCPDPHNSILASAVDPNRNFGEGRTVYFLQPTL